MNFCDEHLDKAVDEYLNERLYEYLDEHLDAHMGHQDQDGEKVGQMSLFDQKLEAATDREKQKFIHFQVLLSNLSWWSIKNSIFRF